MSIEKHLEKYFNVPNKQDVAELVLDGVQIPEIKENETKLLEKYSGALVLSMNNCGLKSLKNLPKMNELEIVINENLYKFFIIFLAKKNKDKKSVLQITPDDIICHLKFSYENSLQSLYLRTFKGKSLSCNAHNEGFNKIEIFENSNERALSVLGFIFGHSDRINSIQFYYEKNYI